VIKSLDLIAQIKVAKWKLRLFPSPQLLLAAALSIKKPQSVMSIDNPVVYRISARMEKQKLKINHFDAKDGGACEDAAKRSEQLRILETRRGHKSPSIASKR